MAVFNGMGRGKSLSRRSADKSSRGTILTFEMPELEVLALTRNTFDGRMPYKNLEILSMHLQFHNTSQPSYHTHAHMLDFVLEDFHRFLKLLFTIESQLSR